MPRHIQPPTIEHKANDPLTDTVERHPAYAQIAANRVTGTAHLYGSDFAHHQFMSIEIKASELHRGLSRDWPFAREEYIEVWLSEAQWATFVSATNSGQGVQCTLAHKDRQSVPGLPAPTARDAQFKQELDRTLQEARVGLLQLRQRIAAGKGGKESLALLDKALQNLGANAVFVAQSFGEHVEDTVEKAKTEVNAYVQHAITRAGLQALQGATPPPIALEEDSA